MKSLPVCPSNTFLENSKMSLSGTPKLNIYYIVTYKMFKQSTYQGQGEAQEQQQEARWAWQGPL